MTSSLSRNEPGTRPGAGKTLAASLIEPVDAASLAVFRIVFGALLFYTASKYLPWAIYEYAPGVFHFKYPFFEWVEPFSVRGMQLELMVMGIAALSLMFGFLSRFSAAVLGVTYTHGVLVEASVYNNHYYLIVLLCFMFVAVDSGATWSVDALLRSEDRRGWVPFWHVALLRAQLVIVYFFGGVAKLNSDWLQGEPMRLWLNRSFTQNELLRSEAAAWFFSYGGLLFDLSIGFLLLHPLLRIVAVVPLLLFHLSNALMFKIGVFPWMMIGATILFFDPALPRRVLAYTGLVEPEADVPDEDPFESTLRSFALIMAGVFIAFQCLFPLRHFAYPGDVGWNEFGHRFSWRMKLRDKQGVIAYVVRDRATGRQVLVDEQNMLQHISQVQGSVMTGRPEFILQYAHFLAELAREDGMMLPEVRVHSLVSLNGRPYRPMVNPDVDLTQIQHPMRQHREWLLPLDPGARLGANPSREEGYAQLRTLLEEEQAQYAQR